MLWRHLCCVSCLVTECWLNGLFVYSFQKLPITWLLLSNQGYLIRLHLPNSQPVESLHNTSLFYVLNKPLKRCIMLQMPGLWQIWWVIQVQDFGGFWGFLVQCWGKVIVSMCLSLTGAHQHISTQLRTQKNTQVSQTHQPRKQKKKGPANEFGCRPSALCRDEPNYIYTVRTLCPGTYKYWIDLTYTCTCTCTTSWNINQLRRSWCHKKWWSSNSMIMWCLTYLLYLLL